jgi:hypothetical protein
MLRLFYLLLFCLSNLSLLSAQIAMSDQATAAGINHECVVPFYVGGGAAFFDYNNDGYEDLYLTGGTNADKLYRNDGNGSFTDVSMASGIVSATQAAITLGVTSGDLDNDGDRDILVTTEETFGLILFRNNGNGTFSNIANFTGMSIATRGSYTASFGDYNEDGFLDIYIANYVDEIGFLYDTSGAINGFAHSCHPNYLYLNNGNMSFTERSAIEGVADTGCSLSASFTDFDSDGDVDLFSINDFGEFIVPNLLFRNDSAVFTDISAASNVDTPGIYGMGIAIGDYDQDMDLDYYVTNIGRNTFYNNQGNASFLDVATTAGVENTYSIPPDSFFTTGWGCAFFDLENDTDLDLYISNGLIPAAAFIQTEENDPNMLYRNNGDGTFTNIADSLGVNSDLVNRGLAMADYDKDGDIDLLSAQLVPVTGPSPTNVLLYQNQTVNTNNWLQVKLQGVITNRDAFGSQIDIYVGGKSWVHEISGGCSHLSQHSSIAHFGLGQDSIVDSLTVRWLSGNVETFYAIPGNQLITIVEDTTSPPVVVVNNDPQSVIIRPNDSLEILDPTDIEIISNVSAFDQQKAWIRAYPNPSQGLVQIEYQIGVHASTAIEVYNSLGQRILRRDLGPSSDAIQYHQLDLTNFAAGHYHVRLITKTENWSQTILLKD